MPRPLLFGIVVGLILGGAVGPVQGQTTAPPVAPLPPSPHHAPGSVAAALPDTLSLHPPHRPSSIRWGRFAVASGLLTSWYTTQYLIERSKWWTGSVTRFHFNSKPGYAQGMDKVAHFYGAEVQALTNARLLEWSGVSASRSALWGAVLSLAGQTNVEIHDGLNERWGFDVYDQLANTLGVTWFYLHDRVPALRRFDVRLMYWPPSAPPIDHTESTQLFTNDYTGHTYWLSMGVWDLLPPSVQPYWPRFLQVSAGVTINRWDTYPDDDAYLSTHLSVDLDWRRIIPRGTLLGRTVGDLLNRYHLPAPALQITPRPGFSLIFVGQ